MKIKMDKQVILMSIWGYMGAGLGMFEFLKKQKLFYTYFLMFGFILFFTYKNIKKYNKINNLFK